MTEFALYVHYPFCIRRCPYCGFASSVWNAATAERYHTALLRELELRGNEPPWRDGRLRSLYFGGGTPSLMPPEQLAGLLEEIKRRFEFPPGIEVTLEANPGAVDKDTLTAFRPAGVNRLSIGAQSLHDSELKFLGRIHSAQEIVETVNAARAAGFDNLSLDIIYGAPGQTVDNFSSSIRQALNLGIDHLSAYALSIESGTEFARLVNGGKIEAPDPDSAAEQYQALCEIMRDAGFDHYELTNFARPGKQSTHNWTYWQRLPYLGLGVSAHSFNGQKRWWNTREIEQYNYLLDIVSLPLEGEETLTELESLEEEAYLSLRAGHGLSLALSLNLTSHSTIDGLIQDGFLYVANGRLHVPEEKWLLLDEIVLKLLADQAPVSP
jgi:oxygen-independent coproporphyrinogen-3 oxidase